MKIVKWHLLLLVMICLLFIAQPVLADGSGQVAIVGRDYVVESGQTLSHDLAVIGGKLTLQPGSEVLGNVAVTGGNVAIAGHITGDLVIIGGLLELENTAIVDGDVVSLGTIDRSSGAIIRGQIVTGLGASADLRSFDRLSSLGSLVQSGQWLHSIVSLFGVFFALCLVVALATILGAIWPDKVHTIGVTMRSSWLQCLGAGLLTLLVVVILVPILVVICIGIPVAVVLLLALAISGLAGWAAIGKIVGERTLQALRTKANPLVETVVGVTLLTVLALIPCLGTLMAIIVGSISIGAVLLTRFGTMCYPTVVHQGSSSGTLTGPTNPGTENPSRPGDQPDPDA